MKAFLTKTRMVLDMIKFEHTIFALPFALISVLLASRNMPYGLPPLTTLFWIVVAMVGARSAAMAFNRLVDAEYDSKNPRTSGRHIPKGLLTRAQVWSFLAVSIGFFEIASWRLNLLCLALSPVALFLVLGYSYTKRFTWLCHVFLGFAIGVAPIGAWLAIRGTLDIVPLLLGAIVTLWIGGFDIIYALQDYDFDVNSPLWSLPKKVGKGRALFISRLMHFAAVALLLLVGVLYGLHALYFLGVIVVAGLLLYEQMLVKPDDLRHVNVAFFTLNGWVSISLFGFVVLDGLFHK